jgi:hypothetical protein
MPLAASPQRTHPETANLETERVQRRVVHWHAVIPNVPADHTAQPRALFTNRTVHASPKLGLDLAQLRLQARAHRLPQHGELSITPLLPANMREAQEVERLGLAQSTSPSVLGRERSKFQQPRLLGVQLQVELGEPFAYFPPEPLGIRPTLKAHHDVVREPHDDHVASRSRPTPLLDPQRARRQLPGR